MAEALLRAKPVRPRAGDQPRAAARAGGVRLSSGSARGAAEGTEDREDLLDAAAVKLFVARARAVDLRFSPDARTVAITGAVCSAPRRHPARDRAGGGPDGHAGAGKLAARLDDRFRLLTGGHRTALPRHQTLRATLDWSYELLPALERTVLHRWPSSPAASRWRRRAPSRRRPTSTRPRSWTAVTNLAAKSLVVVEMGGAVTRYRLLETTRATRSRSSPPAASSPRWATHNAEYYRDLFERAETDWRRAPPSSGWPPTASRSTTCARPGKIKKNLCVGGPPRFFPRVGTFASAWA